MRRWCYRATFSLMVLTLPVWAQGHGGGGGAHFASAGGHSFGGFSSHPTASASFHGGSFSHAAGSGIHVRPGNPYPRRGPYGSRYYYPRGVYYSYYGPYYGWYTDPFDYQNNDDPAADSYADSYAPPPYAEDSGLQRDIQELNGKVDHLQAGLEARNRPKTEEPETALVFRDQHVEEVRNYAIADGNLWVLNDSAAKKIPLTQLDLEATVK